MEEKLIEVAQLLQSRLELNQRLISYGNLPIEESTRLSIINHVLVTAINKLNGED